MKRMAVFCGSGKGTDPVYAEGAKALGEELVRREIGLVYGGAGIGLMGVLADTVLAGGGEVIGVMPGDLVQREAAHTGLTELRKANSMHERKAEISALADGFIALPGGPGTLEEFMEVFTWAQLGYHVKPFGLLNIAGYYDPLLAMFDQMNKEAFLQNAHRELVLQDASADRLVQELVERS
ncbi:TIGR00730 family Rossman fold protein [Salisediminibacterium halotolerans]|uniref:LOG family protein n=1 Tax=Salisediminibacterium halotolerans TaxID=517425 RepID=UPI000EB3FAD5|nr:TIGR00730 family Rossman fold protein [Salisediminibacterium halotolerans]RLJ71677.1 hypothetical protein BCL39_2348 [Actinophytocola xinjiangensis]RPE86827.1 hypothetical protein EDD67_1689 [Salisediminibacterium halotolerans]TWG32890.1 hypothetical protein BCL52_2343 [Salisediminibacterium halotolerans]GEL06982.1 cytokinin riboside 5'-monophosphate phosphoribohydrolase [Salisediminibacterium halotolerans]